MKRTDTLPDTALALFQQLAARARTARYRGRIEGDLAEAARTGSRTHPQCGDRVTFMVVVQAGVITQIRFEAAGCTLSQVAADIAAEYADQKPIVEGAALSDEQLLTLVGLSVGMNRRACVTLAAEALRQLLDQIIAEG